VRARQFVPQPPRPPRDFVNRTAELAQLEAWISANEIVLLYAPDGMGKSALLKQAANSAAAKAMPGGVILVESPDVAGQAFGPDDVAQQLFDALFEANPPLKVDSVSARTYLSNTRPLVLLDEVSLSPALQKMLPDLLPQAAILLTADLPFGGDFQPLAIGPLPRAESIRLLAAKASLVLDDSNRAELDAICASLNDVSLALVIAGNVIREAHIPVATALQAIQETVSSERNPVLVALDRAFSFAFGQLSPDEQKVLSAAALTPGVSLAPEWLALSLPGMGVDSAIERLKSLGLLFANSPRLRLPPGFRALAQRTALLDEDTLMSRLVEFLLAPLRQDPQNWEHARDELGNFFGALTWAVRSQRWATVIALGQALDPYLTLYGLWDAWGIVLGYVVDVATQSGQQAVLAWALHQSGTREIGSGSAQRALDLLKRALELRRGLGDATGMAYTQHNIDLLLLPPAPPRSAGPKPAPAGRGRPGGSWMPVVLGVLGVFGVLAVLMVLLVGAWLFWPTVPPEPYIPPGDNTSTPTAETLAVTPTPSPIPTMTPPPTPTLPGGSGVLVFVGQERARLDVTYDNPCLSGASATSYLLKFSDQHAEPLFTDIVPVRDPAISADGKQIAFVSNGGQPLIPLPMSQASTCSGDIYVADLSGGSARRVTNLNGMGYSHPAWSPDGTKIAFVGGDGYGRTDLFVMDADGSHVIDLTNSPGLIEDYPEWSPDGSRIAYQASSEGIFWEIFVMDAGGSSQKQLTSSDQGKSLQPAWSPDGAQIAFSSNRAKFWNIYVMDADGSNQQAVTNGQANDYGPAWSPDGALIVFNSTRGKKFMQLYMVSPDGSGLVPVPNDLQNLDLGEADWLPLSP
jgi:Cdc6-like AAA superfamily ATPase